MKKRLDLSNMGRPDPFASLLAGAGTEVEYLCPECGGDTAPTTLVTLCPACAGRGRVNDLELSAYLRTQQG